MLAAPTQWAPMAVCFISFNRNSGILSSTRIDPNAVLDGDFKVRGVENLRVVDISSWPKVPRFFVTTPTYMVP
jgi:hypothetical protein